MLKKPLHLTLTLQSSTGERQSQTKPLSGDLSSFFFVGVCMYACVCIYVHVWSCMWTLDGNVGCHSLGIQFFFNWHIYLLNWEVHISWPVYRNQVTALWGQLSSFTTQVPGIQLMSSCLVASTFNHWVISPIYLPLRQSFSLFQNSPRRLGWLVTELQDLPISAFPVLGFQVCSNTNHWFSHGI